MIDIIMEDCTALSRLIPAIAHATLYYYPYGIEPISLSSTVSTVCLTYLMAVQIECPQVINGLKTPDLWTTHYSTAPRHHSPQHLNDGSASAESMHFPVDCP